MHLRGIRYAVCGAVCSFHALAAAGPNDRADAGDAPAAGWILRYQHVDSGEPRHVAIGARDLGCETEPYKPSVDRPAEPPAKGTLSVGVSWVVSDHNGKFAVLPLSKVVSVLPMTKAMYDTIDPRRYGTTPLADMVAIVDDGGTAYWKGIVRGNFSMACATDPVNSPRNAAGFPERRDWKFLSLNAYPGGRFAQEQGTVKKEEAQWAGAKARDDARQQQARAAFARGLKVGDGTNCGMVVELKPQIVLVQGNGSPRWMRRDKLAPEGAACEGRPS